MHPPLPPANRPILAAFIAALLTLSASCAKRPANRSELHVAAASSLAAPFTELGDAFAASSGAQVILSLGATGHLVQQIRNGAPYDLFASADAHSMDTLADEGLLNPDTRRLFALGRLILLVRPEVDRKDLDLTDLQSPRIGRIAIANPEHAPYGTAAREALIISGLWGQVQPKIIFAETVRQAVQFVESGNADAALVAESLPLPQDLGKHPIDQAAYRPIEHWIAALARASNPLGKQFLAFLASDEGLRILEANSLAPPSSGDG